MNKSEFIAELRKRLTGLPEDDINASVDYYSEMIDDRVEDGMTEDEAVTALGSMDTIVERILSSCPMRKIVREKITHRRGLSALEIVLLVVGFPIWFPIFITLLSVIISIYISIWAVNVSFYAFTGASIVMGLVATVSGIVGITAPAGAGVLGSGLLILGIGGLALIGSIYTSIGIVKLTKLIWNGIKSLFVGGKK